MRRTKAKHTPVPLGGSTPVCDSDPRPLIPEGDYLAGCTGAPHSYHAGYKREVIYLHFVIIPSPPKKVKV